MYSRSVSLERLTVEVLGVGGHTLFIARVSGPIAGVALVKALKQRQPRDLILILKSGRDICLAGHFFYVGRKSGGSLR